MIGIYKITSPSNKIYVGQSINIEKRFGQYKRLDCKKQPKLYNSLVKYGVDIHKFEIIEECNLEQLNKREIYWKQYYNTINEGLNCELFDIGQGYRSDEVKTKISNSLKGKPKSQEHCLNLSKARIGIPSKRKDKPDLKQKGVSKPTAGGKGKPKVGAGPKKGNSIMNTITGEIYDSIKKCMDYNKISKRKMFKLLKQEIEYKYINKNYYK
jgi:group I intron endonuclease